jgi:hypothetical protein
MIFPINNIETREGDSFLVNLNRHFYDSFPVDSHPLLFGSKSDRTYIAFRDDKETVYQWHGYNSSEDPVRIRLLKPRGAKKVRKWIDEMIQLQIGRANNNIKKNVERFKELVEMGAAVDAEKEIEAMQKSLEITVGGGFPFQYVKLDKCFYPMLDMTSEKMRAELPKVYWEGINYYERQAEIYSVNCS